MQIAATDSTIAFILEPTEAQALLDKLNGMETKLELISELHERLADFVYGPDEEGAA